MKKYQSIESQKSGAGNKQDATPLFSHPQLSTLNSQLAFTLIELLVVISIIGVLAGFTFPIMFAAKKNAFINKTKAEMGLLETAIQGYHNKLGFYPPGNPNNAVTNQLYYELEGTVTNTAGFQTLDGSSIISTAYISSTFGTSGFMNCTKGVGEDVVQAKNFLTGLKPGQTATDGNVVVLTGSIGGPDTAYQPMTGFTSDTGSKANSWRYVSPGVNNPGSYDLWIQLSIKGKTYLVCNWSGQVQINSPLP